MCLVSTEPAAGYRLSSPNVAVVVVRHQGAQRKPPFSGIPFRTGAPARGRGRHDERVTQLKPPATTVAEWTATLLWEACRREPRADSVRRALDEGADIELAASAAADHRVSPLLWRALGRSGSLDVLGTDRALGGVRDALKMEALLLLPRAVALAVQPLTDAGLEPVVFKGPAVAARYPEPGLRPMDDIDLLLPQADHRRALDALGQAGWQVARAGDDAYDTSLIHGEVPSLFLELHYGLEYASHRVSAPALDADTLWACRQPLDCAGTPAFGLPPAEELVMLAVHAGKPQFRAAGVDRRPCDDRRRRRQRRHCHRLGPGARRGGVGRMHDGRRRRPGDGPSGRRRNARGVVPAADPGPAGRRCGSAALGHLAVDPCRAAPHPAHLHVDPRPIPACQVPLRARRLGPRAPSSAASSGTPPTTGARPRSSPGVGAAAASDVSEDQCSTGAASAG